MPDDVVHAAAAPPIVLAAVLYVLASRRIGARGRSWPRARGAAFVAGCASLLAALALPLAAGDDDPRVHMAQHLLLGMVAPLLLALSVPLTLLLAALPRARRRPVVRVLHLRPLRMLVHPAVAAALVVGGLYALYLTPLYAAALEHESLHGVVHLHVLVAGCLLAWATIGLDPIPRRPSRGVRLAALLAALALHTALARVLLADAEGIAARLGQSPSAWRTAAEIMWFEGDLIDLAWLVAFVATGDRARRRRARCAAEAASQGPVEHPAPGTARGWPTGASVPGR